MFTAHKHLDHERRKTEGNPINGSICYSLLNGNTFKIVFVTCELTNGSSKNRFQISSK